jgi:hypothetical protein
MDTTVPELCLDVFDILSLFDQNASIGMSQIMKPHSCKLSSYQGWVKAFSQHPGVVLHLPFWIWKY